MHGSPVQGDSLTTVAGDELDREPAQQTPDYDRMAKNLDKKSPLEIMDQACDSVARLLALAGVHLALVALSTLTPYLCRH